MPVSLTTLTGPIYMPNGATPIGGRVSFELSSWDREEGEALVVSGPTYSNIDENGQFSVELFTTTEGVNTVNYRMYVLWEDSTLSQSYVNDVYVSSPAPHYTKKYIGSFALSGPGPFRVSDLNIMSELELNSFDVLLECQAYALAAKANVEEVSTALNVLVVDANNAADLSQAWAESPTSPDGGPSSKSSKIWASEAADSASAAASSAATSTTKAAEAAASATDAQTSKNSAALSASLAAAAGGATPAALYYESLFEFTGEVSGDWWPSAVALDGSVIGSVGRSSVVPDIAAAMADYYGALYQFMGDGDPIEAPTYVAADGTVLGQKYLSIDSTPSFMGFVDGGDLRVVGGQSGDVIVNEDVGKTWISGREVGGRLRAVYQADGNYSMAAVSPVSGDVFCDGVMGLRLQVGQSNGRGSQSGAAEYTLERVDYPYPGNLLMLQHAGLNVWAGTTATNTDTLSPGDLTGLEPLSGAILDTNGTTSVESAALRYFTRCAAGCGGYVPKMIVANVAMGGQSIDQLSKNPTDPAVKCWANLVTVLSRAEALRPSDRRVVLDWLHMHQGESDTANALLGSLHDAFRADVQAEAALIFGQVVPVRMISWQPASYQNSIGARSILSHFQSVRASRGNFWCGGPSYQFPFADTFLHHTSLGHDMRGEYEDEIIRRVERDGVFDPLTMVSAAITGTSEITVTLSHSATIDLADSVVAVVANAGITVGGKTVSAVTVSGTTMVVTTTTPAAGATAVRAAMVGQGSPRTQAEIPRTNIRGTASLGSYRSGKTMRRWLCAQEIKL